MMANLRVEAPEKHLQIGDPFPVLSGQFLTGRDAALPQESSGSTRLVAMGFTYKSRFPVEAWAEWYSTAIGRREDITLFEVPMISGLATLSFPNRMRPLGSVGVARATALARPALATRTCDVEPTSRAVLRTSAQ